MSGKLNIAVARFWGSMVSSLADWRARDALAQEFKDLGPDESDRVFRDCGVDRGEFAKSVRNPLVSEDLLSSAMEAIGFEPNLWRKRYPSWYRDMARVCMACPNRRRCRDDISAGRVSALRTYCPNDDSFEEMALMELRSQS